MGIVKVKQIQVIGHKQTMVSSGFANKYYRQGDNYGKRICRSH